MIQSEKREDNMNEPTSRDNRSNQMNPNNDAYWRARGWSSRPRDWKARSGMKERSQADSGRVKENQAS